MANTVYENFVLENKLSDLLNTKLNTRSIMKIDSNLVGEAGLIKKINRYTYTGAVQDVLEGATNTIRGAVSFTPTQYEVVVSQQVFDYTDEQFLQDPNVVDMGMKGGSDFMVNDLNTKFFAELAKASLSQDYPLLGAISYDTIVDAISQMNLEDESGLYVLIGTDLKAAIRKDADFKAAQFGQILFNGQIGTISGLPVILSKLVPADAAYVAHPEAVTLFVKKESEIEQDRQAEVRTNTIIMRKVHLVALTDATKVVKIVRALA